MRDVATMAIPTVDGVGIELPGPHTLRLKGTITRKEPSEDLSRFFRSLHDQAVRDKAPELRIQLADLTFVNSSSIRLFIDWAVWVRNEPEHRYTLRFVTSRQVTWQQTAFAALSSLMRDVVCVDRI
jgi:hypothetical protein